MLNLHLLRNVYVHFCIKATDLTLLSAIANLLLVQETKKFCDVGLI